MLSVGVCMYLYVKTEEKGGFLCEGDGDVSQ